MERETMRHGEEKCISKREEKSARIDKAKNI